MDYNNYLMWCGFNVGEVENIINTLTVRDNHETVTNDNFGYFTIYT